MPNLRKAASVLTYNDDEIFKAFENFTKIRKTTNQPVKTQSFFKEDKGIPEVLYADDGRKFFPCYFCCRAFAFKNDQFTHMEQCTFRTTSKSEPALVQVKETTQNTSSPQNRAFITKKVQNNLSQPNTLTKQVRRLSNVTSKKVLVSKIQHGALKSHIIKAKHRKVQNNPTKPGILVKTFPLKVQENIALKSMALVTKTARNKIQNDMSASNLTPKRAAITVQNRKLIQNIKQEIDKSEPCKNLHLSANTPKPKNNQAIKVIRENNKNTSPLLQNSKLPELPVVQSPIKVQNKTAFPKIKLGLREEHVKTEFVDCTPPQYFENVCESTHNNEKHTFQKITIRMDEVPYYDEIYRNSGRKQCPICHKPLSKQYWRRHLKIHTEEKDYFCTVCGKGFGRKDHRDMHERKHINLIGNADNA